jgi:hypothetical protein
MPLADFQVTLQFRGYPVAEGVIGTGSEEAWLRDFASAVTQHAHGSGMCSDWRNAFRGDETVAHDLEEAQPEVQLFYVIVRPRLTAQVAVNGNRSPAEAAQALENHLRNDIEWTTVDGMGDYDLSEAEVIVAVDHQGTRSPDEVPSDYWTVEV